MMNIAGFFQLSPPQESLLHVGHYDPMLVSLSLLAAILASYGALLAAEHAVTKDSRIRQRWLVIGGICMGAGVWAMHFLGMLAFTLPCTTRYTPELTLLSMAPAVIACIFAISIVSRPVMTNTQLLTGGVLIGAGIGIMHYLGMAAMRIDGLVRYDPSLFLLSILVAVMLASLALWIKLRLHTRFVAGGTAVIVPSAIVMGLAVAGMHYTAMSAAYFIRTEGSATPESEITATYLATVVLAVTGLIVVLTIIASQLSARQLRSMRRSLRLIVLLAISWAAVAWVIADYYLAHQALQTYNRQIAAATQQAEQFAVTLDTDLRMLKGVARVVASDGKLVDLLDRSRSRRQSDSTATLSAFLERMANQLGVDELYLLDDQGTCLAASNFRQTNSFVANNFRDRLYFQAAARGESGRQFAVGRISKVAGLYYSSPVLQEGRFLGAVVVKREVPRYDQAARRAGAMIVDANGVIVLSALPGLAFKAMPGGVVLNMTGEDRVRQYARDSFETVSLRPWQAGRFAEARLLDDDPLPVALANRSLAEDDLTVFVPQGLTELARFSTERNGLFLLIAFAGVMMIAGAATIAFHLRESKATASDLRVAATAFESQLGMVITDAQQVILRINQAFTDITGYAADEVVGQRPSMLASGRHDPGFYGAMWSSINETGSWQGEIWNRRRNGQEYPEWLTITAVRGAEGAVTHYVGTLTDMSERKAVEEEIQNLAYYDSLTHLPNRRLLTDRLVHAQAASARSDMFGALLFIDLDNFKTINDTQGHESGDQLLVEVAKRLSAGVREGDTVARFGGDEFVIMLDRLSASQEEAATRAERIGEKLIASLNQPYDLSGFRHHSTCSIGATLFSGHHESLDDLLKHADLAMYQAKAAGKDTLRFYDPAMQARVSAQAQLEADLRHAVIEQHFLIHYQAQVDASGRVVGAEALVRWHDPKHGMMSPALFIPLAEETGLIVPLGHIVLEQACRQLAEWQHMPDLAHLTLSVNVSARQFKLPNIVDQVLAVVDHYRVPRDKLKIELTESVMVDNPDAVIQKMLALKAEGIGFSMDDFGTGYSSLTYLKQLPLDQLKIDRSFVQDVLTDPNDAAIARTIVALGKSLGLAVIAEGVETEAQRQFLAESGCLAYQGYLFSRPLAADDFAAWMKQRAA